MIMIIIVLLQEACLLGTGKILRRTLDTKDFPLGKTRPSLGVRHPPPPPHHHHHYYHHNSYRYVNRNFTL